MVDRGFFGYFYSKNIVFFDVITSVTSYRFLVCFVPLSYLSCLYLRVFMSVYYKLFPCFYHKTCEQIKPDVEELKVVKVVLVKSPTTKKT